MVCVLSVLSTSAWAQTTVKGIVVDAETTEPLIGAAVMEDGTTNGTATDIDGAFELTVSRSGSLTLKYVGYKDLHSVAGGKGIGIISTNQGLMPTHVAKQKKLGGELIAEIY